jgi:hypothetical protein
MVIFESHLMFGSHNIEVHFGGWPKGVLKVKGG